jgi:hypothetical protein
VRLDVIICDFCKCRTEAPLSSIEVTYRKPANPDGWDEPTEKKTGDICKDCAANIIRTLAKQPDIKIEAKSEPVYRGSVGGPLCGKDESPYMGAFGSH